MNLTEAQEFLFMQVVFQNQQLGLIGLGKLKNPISNKEEINLEQAKMAIDILDMLTIKTKGNLSEREDHFLQDVLRDLKLNYISETSK
ncbi:MAG: DUF1844 domain-containing protein [Ignavibacteriales bacterium]|nr:DUF1844 domain-containing protein [Ignavibacteriales bacterium]